MPRTRQEAVDDKRAAIESAQASGQVADSDDVRLKLIQQMQRGEKTLAEVQAELAQIKRGAKKAGKLTRQQIWSQS